MAGLCNSILQGTTHTMSNGSYIKYADLGAAAWIFTKSDYNMITEGTSIVPVQGETHSPFCSEIIGILVILQKLHDLCDKYYIQSGHITLHGDNKSALKVIARW